jgi:hypothetical protein
MDLMNPLVVSREVHRRNLAQLEAAAEPESEFERAMRRGSIYYRQNAIDAIDRLLQSEEAASCPK